MNDIENIQLAEILQSMIKDKVMLIHAGQIIDWNDTDIPEILKRLEQFQGFDDHEIPSGTLLVNKYSGQKAAVVNDKNGTVSMVLNSSILTYPKKWIWSHFEISETGK